VKKKAAGRGKLILFGEHAAVYGHPAVGTPLPCRTEIWMGPPRAGKAEEVPDEDTALLQELITEAAAITGKTGIENLNNRAVYQSSNVPRTGGFGSSAALCVSVSRLILSEFGPGYSRDVHLLANRLEERFHGTPSGIDTGMASDTSVSAWIGTGGDIPERRPLRLPSWSIIYGALPRSSTTGESVGKLRHMKESGDRWVISAMEKLGRISSEFIQAASLPRNETVFPVTAAGLANEAQTVLASLGLSTEELNIIIRMALNMGATGGKLSGAGMGGAFFLTAGSPGSRDRLMAGLSKELSRRGIRLTEPLTPLDF